MEKAVRRVPVYTVIAAHLGGTVKVGACLSPPNRDKAKKTSRVWEALILGEEDDYTT